MPVQLRRASAADAEVIHSVMRESYAEYRGLLNPPQMALSETAVDVARAIEAGGGAIALEDRHAIGSVRFHLEGQDVCIERLCVLPKWRRAGVARRLLRFAEEAGAAQGARRARLGVRLRLEGNLRLYRSAGYGIVGLRRRSEDEVSAVMVKGLEGASEGLAIEEVLSAISLELRRAEPAALALLLHGSAARGTPGPFSDIDLRIVTEGEPLARERLLVRESPFGGFFLISATAQGLGEIKAAAKDPAEWAWMQGAYGEAKTLYDPQGVLQEIRRAVAESMPSAQEFARSAPKALSSLLEATAKVKNAAASGDAQVAYLAAHQLGESAVRLLAPLNPPCRLSPALLLRAPSGWPVVPEHFLADLAVVLGAGDGQRGISKLLARCLRLGEEVLGLIAERAGELHLPADLDAQLRSGVLLRLLGQEQGWTSGGRQR